MNTFNDQDIDVFRVEELLGSELNVPYLREGIGDGVARRVSRRQFLKSNIFVQRKLSKDYMMIECGMDVLAFYISPHVSKKYWGIYVKSSGISTVSNFFAEKILANPKMNELFHGARSQDHILDSTVKAAKILLLRHELGHYAIDYSLTELCDANKNEYLQVIKHLSNHNENPMESICNANIARQSLIIYDRFAADHSTGLYMNLDKFSRDFMDMQPHPYRGYGKFVSNYLKSSTAKLKAMTGLEFNLDRFKTASKDNAKPDIPLYMVE